MASEAHHRPDFRPRDFFKRSRSLLDAVVHLRRRLRVLHPRPHVEQPAILLLEVLRPGGLGQVGFRQLRILQGVPACFLCPFNDY